MSLFFFFFKQKTAYEMRISDWSSDVCSSDLRLGWRLAAPQHKLEDGIEALAFVDRAFDQRFGELERQRGVAADQHAVAEQYGAAVRPELEMAEPELLVDQSQCLMCDRALVLDHADVGTGKSEERRVGNAWVSTCK